MLFSAPGAVTSIGLPSASRTLFPLSHSAVSSTVRPQARTRTVSNSPRTPWPAIPRNTTDSTT